jgi:hypothetical protein
VGSEQDPIVRDLAPLCQAEHLKTARIGQDRAVPTHEPVQPTQLGYYVSARAQVQMVGITQDELGAQTVQITRIQR